MNKKFRMLVLLALLLSLTSIDTGLAKTKKKKDVPTGTPILWQRPTDISSRDLFLGPGGAAMRPDLRRITFIKEEKGGYSKKFEVRDGSGRRWVAKIGNEAQSETSAIRLLWGVGYVTEVNYLAASDAPDERTSARRRKSMWTCQMLVERLAAPDPAARRGET